MITSLLFASLSSTIALSARPAFDTLGSTTFATNEARFQFSDRFDGRTSFGAFSNATFGTVFSNEAAAFDFANRASTNSAFLDDFVSATVEFTTFGREFPAFEFGRTTSLATDFSATRDFSGFDFAAFSRNEFVSERAGQVQFAGSV